MRSLDVDVGVVPAAVQRGQKLVKVHFHGFSDLDSTKGNDIDSNPFDCFNHKWLVQLFPGGDADAEDGMVSVYLSHLSDNEVTVYFDMVIRDGEGNIIEETRWTLSHTFDTSDTFDTKTIRGWNNDSWGRDNFIERSVLLKPGNLSNGTLTIEVQMKLDESKSQLNFVPKNPFANNMLKLLLDEDTADVLFGVSGEQFHAHRVVLKAGAPELARLCEDTDETTPVIIPDVEPKVFKMLLKYVYGGEVEADWKTDAKKYLDAADKYGIIGLKVEAEALYVTYHNFTVDNAVEDLLYADGKNYPLLREAAMKFIMENAKEVIESSSFENVLMTKEITKEIMRGMAKGGCVSDGKMTVNDLRMALDDKGLDVDGSREMLASRLKN